jgi:hypothetical protein
MTISPFQVGATEHIAFGSTTTSRLCATVRYHAELPAEIPIVCSASSLPKIELQTLMTDHEGLL